MTYNILVKQLSKHLDKDLVKILLNEYVEIKRNHFLNDWEKVVLHAGKFCEINIAVLYYLKTKEIIDLNNIRFNEIYESLLKMPKKTSEDEVITLIIPRVTRAIYTIRSKRSVAHIKDVDPSYLDSTYAVATCDWIVSELIRLFHISDPSEVTGIIGDLIKKQVPIIEEFGTDLMVLETNVTALEEIMIIVYQKKEAPISDLKRYCRHWDRTTVTNAIRNAESKKLIFISDEKICKITKLGIKFVEEKLREEILTKI